MLFSPLRSIVGRLRSLTFPCALTLVLAFSLAAPGAARADQGYATWYGAPFQGHEMASGLIYDMYDPTTTACNIYPMGTWIKVTNPANGRSVVVQVRDTGGFTHALDLSYAAFKLIADPDLMEIPVQYTVVSGPSGKPAATPTPAATRAEPSSRGSRPAASNPPQTYVVQAGDTLNSIADQFGIDSAKLVAWNQLANPDAIVEGQTLRLTAPAAQPAASSSSGSKYVVQPGDTLGGIAVKFGLEVADLAVANNLSDPYPIVIGQSLTIPSGATSGAA
ncbi:MAG TPA: LysM peptidoglycan-binding domain-containing protein, partial [Chloroflexota bacterium]|nr:LysM peptidoglycan-binding domain-containing protein [Chloroflexota bacterium]